MLIVLDISDGLAIDWFYALFSFQFRRNMYLVSSPLIKESTSKNNYFRPRAEQSQSEGIISQACYQAAYDSRRRLRLIRCSAGLPYCSKMAVVLPRMTLQ